MIKVYRRLPSIKALSFDLDDTLYDNHPIIANVEQEMAIWLHTNHPVSTQWTVEKWKSLKFELLTNNPNLKHDVTLWRETQIIEGLKRLGYDDLNAQSAATLGMKHALFLRNQVEVPLESHQTLQTLSQVFPIIAITNGNVDVEQIGLGRYFDKVLKSGPDGRSKPHSDMFISAKKLLGYKAHEILHIGDHLISDVSGAKRAGFTACWINTSGRAITEHRNACTLPDIEITRINELLSLL